MPRAPPVPKLKNGPTYQLREHYPPSNYAALVPSKKRAKDHGHLNATLEGELIVANERKYGSYPARKIARKCAHCSGYLMLVTNVGAGMKVYSSQDLEFQSLGSQTIRCNSCQSHHAVLSGFTEEELKAMPAIQTILPLRQTVDNGHFIGPGSALSILPLEAPRRRHRRLTLVAPSSTTPTPRLARPVGPPRRPVAIEISDDEVDTLAPRNSARRGRVSMPAMREIIEISDNEVDVNAPRNSARRRRASMPAIRKVDRVVDTDTNGRSAELQGKIAILFFEKLDENPIRIDVPTRNNGNLYLGDHKIDLGLAGIEMGEQFEVFGFASEDGWTKVRWSEPLRVVEGSPLFMKKCGTEDPGFWNNWKTAALEGFIFRLLK
ncbi:hypothetical protein ARMSODRAFT_1017584 [Armillaria solidipes]|uniref:Uncharacterized protein n=1 Tax=Armillaria solidipes TaxID=1076256 RepID=A0A2H3C666_9AGAR|nr:hypothetical protein ARMSODRAFT_1017584 [Armillaria solidipes]